MPIAKETLKIGFTVAAVKGGYVTDDAVKTYGWSHLVEPGPDPEVAGADRTSKSAPE